MDWPMIGMIVFVLFLLNILSSFHSRGDGQSEERLFRLERKLDRILDHLGIERDTAAEQAEELEDLIRSGKKINAIKLYRDRTGLDLKESKDAVEQIEARLKRSDVF